jgi:ER membrane protein complex subunit 2
MFYEC